MRLSYSAISTYQKCPLSYKFLYKDRLPTKPSHHLSFGNSIHSALEFFYKAGPTPVSLDRLLEELDNVWLREGYENEKHEQEYKEKGRSILTQFYSDNAPTFALPVAVEKRFALDIEGITVSGVIDRIDRLESGGLEIIDYKTNGKLPPRSKITTDLQLPIYHMAAQEMYGVAPDKVTLYFLVPNQKMSARKTKTDVDKTKKTILEVAGRITKQNFEPFKNPLCAWCDFIELCSLHKNDPVMLAKAAGNGKISNKGSVSADKQTTAPKTSAIQSELDAVSKAQGTYSPKAMTPDTTSPDAGARPMDLFSTTMPTINELKQNATDIERAVDEYLDSVEQIKKYRKRLDELQATIHNHCETNDAGSVCGSKGVVGRGTRRTTHYNVDKLRELLEPKRLWEKVIDVNSELLKNLVNDDSSRNEILKLIETAKEMEEIGYYLYIKDELKEETNDPKARP